MMEQQQAGVDMIAFVAERLGELCDQVVFVGGAVVGLLVTDPAAHAARSTDDVDVIVQAATYSEHTRLEEYLRRRGFRNGTVTGDPICRWRVEGAAVDVMPTEESVFGFRNRWYNAAMQNATVRTLRPDLRIRLISAPCFVATKIDAFNDRGNGDYQGSRDIEDIISVVDGREELPAEVSASQQDIRDFVAERFDVFLHDEDFLDALSSHLYPDDASQGRVSLVTKRMLEISHT